MKAITLTQMLYEATEVELSLMVAIVTKAPQANILFWGGELARTGLHERLWAVLWHVYYDFYASAYPALAEQIHEWHTNYLEVPNDESVARTVCNLHTRTPRTEVFESRLYSQSGGEVHPRQFKDLPALWLNGTLLEVGSFLYSTDLPADLLTRSIVTTFPGRTLPVTRGIHHDHRHILLAAVTSARLPPSEVAPRHLVVDVLDSSIEAMQDIGSFDETSHYYYLSDRRWIPTDKRLGCFALPRYTLDSPLTEHLWFHWEYYAFNSPLWQQRFSKHGATADHATKTIAFQDEDTEEGFFQEWNLLPDEQPKAVQAKASGQIVAINYRRWFRETFGKSATLAVPEPVHYFT